MTENECIEILKNNFPKTCKMVDGRYKGGFDDAESELGRAFCYQYRRYPKSISTEQSAQSRNVGRQWKGRGQRNQMADIRQGICGMERIAQCVDAV